MKPKNSLVRWGIICVVALFALPPGGQDEAKLYERECGGCHALSSLVQRNWAAKQWQEAIVEK